MDKFAEWMLMNMFGKYYAEIGNWKCLKEKSLPCICVSGEMLNHAISAMLMFYSLPNMEYRVTFIDIEEELCPKLVKVTNKNEEIPYIAIKKDEKCEYNGNVIGFPKCNINDGDRLYLTYNEKKFQDEIKQYNLESYETNEEKYEKLILKLEANLINNCRTVDQEKMNYGMLRNSMMLHTIRRMRIINSSDAKKALLAIRFFLGAKESFTLLNNYVNNAKFSDEQKGIVKKFIERYNRFIKRFKGNTIPVDYFAKIFYEEWNVDISYMLHECVEKNGHMIWFSQMLGACYEEHNDDDLKELISSIEQKVEYRKQVC